MVNNFYCWVFLLLIGANVCAESECGKPGKQVLMSIVKISTSHGSQASGIVIAPGRVLTAAHVLEGVGPYFVDLRTGLEEAGLQAIDRSNDLAVLSVPTHGLVPIPFSVRDLDNSEPVWALGYPLDGELTLSSGYFEEFVGGALHTSATIDSGQSGGGLVICEANQHVLAGMLRAYGAFRRDNALIKIDNFSISVPTRTIRSFLLN